MLIERGADATAQDSRGLTPLHFASQRGQVDTAKMLINHGKAPTDQDNIWWLNVDTVHMVIERMADLDGCRSTLLHLALEEGEVDVVRMLYKTAAYLAKKTNSLHLALENGDQDLALMLIGYVADLTA